MWRYISKKLFNLNNNFATTNTGTSLCFQFASGEPIFLLKQKSVDGDFPVDGQRKDLSPFLGERFTNGLTNVFCLRWLSTITANLFLL